MVDEDIRNALVLVADGGPLSIDDLCASVVRSARRRRRRQFAAGAVVVVALAVSVWALRPTGSEPVITVGSMPVPDTPGGSVAASTDPTAEEYVDPTKVARYPGWLAEYDPAEVAYLRSVDPAASDAKLVVTLEYRQACRSTDAAVTELSAVDPAVLPERARTLMTPVVERLTERETSAKSGADDQFADLLDRLTTGDIAGVRAWLDVNCASSFTQSVPGARPDSGDVSEGAIRAELEAFVACAADHGLRIGDPSLVVNEYHVSIDYEADYVDSQMSASDANTVIAQCQPQLLAAIDDFNAHATPIPQDVFEAERDRCLQDAGLDPHDAQSRDPGTWGRCVAQAQAAAMGEG